mmetsp:Transcript_7110/g.24637  ORF Transcript_7110/g.24637 Transcript_7110/m.24637 type:complete len:299 (+) Transcript_7110:80-976(+)
MSYTSLLSPSPSVLRSSTHRFAGCTHRVMPARLACGRSSHAVVVRVSSSQGAPRGQAAAGHGMAASRRASSLALLGLAATASMPTGLAWADDVAAVAEEGAFSAAEEAAVAIASPADGIGRGIPYKTPQFVVKVPDGWRLLPEAGEEARVAAVRGQMLSNVRPRPRSAPAQHASNHPEERQGVSSSQVHAGPRWAPEPHRCQVCELKQQGECERGCQDRLQHQAHPLPGDRYLPVGHRGGGGEAAHPARLQAHLLRGLQAPAREGGDHDGAAAGHRRQGQGQAQPHQHRRAREELLQV